MSSFKKFDFVKFHTPIGEQEAKEVYLIVDDLAEDEDVKSLQVMEIHQTLSIPSVNTFCKSDFKLDMRPSESQIKEIISGKNLQTIK